MFALESRRLVSFEFMIYWRAAGSFGIINTEEGEIAACCKLPARFIRLREQNMPIQPGISSEMTMIVQETDTARHTGGETLPPVLATPRMISYMERTAHQAVLPYLEEGQTTVGTLVNVRHIAATPAGMQVRFRAELVEVDRRRLLFRVEAWDAMEKVGEGEHERFVIDQGRFNGRLAEKQAFLKKE